MQTVDPEQATVQDRQAKLARAFIEEYLRSKGYSLKTICQLPEEQAKRLMIDASIFTSLKLAELENRAQLVHELHGTL